MLGAGEVLKKVLDAIAIRHPSRLDSRPVSGHGVTFFRGNDATDQQGAHETHWTLDSRVRGNDAL